MKSRINIKPLALLVTLLIALPAFAQTSQIKEEKVKASKMT